MYACCRGYPVHRRRLTKRGAWSCGSALIVGRLHHASPASPGKQPNCPLERRERRGPWCTSSMAHSPGARSQRRPTTPARWMGTLALLRGEIRSPGAGACLFAGSAPCGARRPSAQDIHCCAKPHLQLTAPVSASQASRRHSSCRSARPPAFAAHPAPASVQTRALFQV